LASLVDSAIALGLLLVVLVLSAIAKTVSDGLGGLLLFLGYIAIIAFGFWQRWVEGETGQTIGKKQIGISVVRQQDGQYIGGLMGIVRNLAHIVDGITCYVGFLWPLWDEKRQTFADKVMGTVVIEKSN